MASNPGDAASELADLLTTVASSLLDQASQQAASAPERLAQAVGDALDQAANAGQDIAALPAQALDAMRNAADHPDWLGVLTFALVRLVDLVGDPALTVVGYDPGDGWARAVGVRYAPDDANVLLVSFAIATAGTHGVAVRVVGDPTLTVAAGPAMIEASAHGSGEWRFGFGTPLRTPAAAASLSVTVALAHDLLPASTDPIVLAVGRPRIMARAASQPPTWLVEAAFEGANGGPGVRAAIDLAPILGALVSVAPIDERYRPLVSVGSGRSPRFDLNHQGL